MLGVSGVIYVEFQENVGYARVIDKTAVEFAGAMRHGTFEVR